MLGLDTLDVAIGLVFVYLMVSFVCSAGAELVEMLLKQRSKHLQQGITSLLKNGAADLYKHPLVTSLTKSGDLPSYIPPRNFALAVLNLIGTDATDPTSIKSAIDALKGKNDDLYKALSSIYLGAEGKLDDIITGIQDWYNSAMDRVSGWYKRYAQWWLLAFGIIVAVAVNVDTIAIVKYLSVNKTKREAIVASAGAAVQKGLPQGQGAGTIQQAEENLVKSVDDVKALGLPVGWDNPPDESCWQRIVGWLLTAIAVSFGAPFWFDVLNKFMVVRSTVKPTEKSGQEQSKDAK